MLKKLLVPAAILVMVSQNTIANTPAPYLGISTGVTTITSSNAGSYRGAPVTVFAGYGSLVNQTIYLGGELFGTLGMMELNNNNAGPYSLRSSYGYGISFIPGVMLAEQTMGFARIGIVRSRFSNMQANANASQIGLGLQTALIQNWDIRGEYDYNKYGTVRGLSPRSDSFNLGFIYKID